MIRKYGQFIGWLTAKLIENATPPKNSLVEDFAEAVLKSHKKAMRALTQKEEQS